MSTSTTGAVLDRAGPDVEVDGAAGVVGDVVLDQAEVGAGRAAGDQEARDRSTHDAVHARSIARPAGGECMVGMGMADEPYRGTRDTLDAGARELDAKRELAEWRYQLLTRVTLVFMGIGLGVACAVVGVVDVVQRELFGGSSWLKVSLVAGIAAWAVTIGVGKLVAKQVARRRTAAAVERVAARHQVAVEVVARSLTPL
jgi:hypothetical protein